MNVAPLTELIVTVVWLAPLLVPLLTAPVVALRPGLGTSWLLIVAPVPAGLLAITGAPALPPTLTWLLLDTQLALDALGRVLLAAMALVWVVAGVYGRSEAEQRGSYGALWSLALLGNVGVVLADDVISFYAAFVVMTLAAYGLVVHRRDAATLRAGRIYLVLGIVGETVLLAGLLLAVSAAPGLQLAEVAAAIATAELRGVIVASLIVGFGIKAGVIGLHVWLPLAHPAAPFAASAVLSGAMIKAGLVGWLRLLPVGSEPMAGPATVLIGLGFATVVVGVALGLTQRGPKVVLAYSSVSQMGFITMLVGVALTGPAVAVAASAAAVVYAWHHGLAKAALFLAVGLLPNATTGWQRRLLFAGLAVAGLALAGAPISSGAFAKGWMKQTMELGGLAPWTVTLASIAAAGTTALMIRLVVLLRATRPDPAAPGVALGPWLVLLVGVLVATPLIAGGLLPVLTPLGASSLVLDAAWPVLLGAGLAVVVAAVVQRRRVLVPDVPAGDVVVLAERAVAAVGRGLRRAGGDLAPRAARGAARLGDAVEALGRRDEGLDRLEDRLTRWRTGGAMGALVLSLIALALFTG